jgi:isoquinoline 1-oxidoreductase beta subunit
VQGAAIMALGTTMPTHRVTFKNGAVEQNNFNDMAMPRMPDAPKVMTVSIVPSSDAPKGMGEPGLPPLAPALANAVARLTGKRQRELPFSFA